MHPIAVINNTDHFDFGDNLIKPQFLTTLTNLKMAATSVAAHMLNSCRSLFCKLFSPPASNVSG